MTSPAEQPTLDLGEYRGKNILRTSVKLANSNDGFHPSTDLDEPRIFELDEELTVAIRIKVTGHNPKLIEKGEDAELGMVELLQTFKCGTIAIIPDTGTVKKALDTVEARRAAARAAEAAKKPAAKKVRRSHLAPVGESLEAALQTDDGYTDTDPPGSA
jgi:hypothetical protein